MSSIGTGVRCTFISKHFDSNSFFSMKIHRTKVPMVCLTNVMIICFQYDLSASQFSPDGRVFQIDYAAKAIEQSGTVIGLRGKNGVVLAVEKIVRSPLYEEDAGARIYNIDKHIGMVNAI